MQYLEAHQQQLDFHEWTYMMTVTMTTVGYGDIVPRSAFGRCAIMAIIYFAIVFVPMQTNKLIEMMGRQSVYARARYKPRGLAKHVIVCGDLESTSLREFFRELFHEDHENINLNAVILQPAPPSFEMLQALQDPVFSLVVHFIEGSPLKDADLGRAKADSAVAIFLLSDKFCEDADREDTKIILQQLSIERYMLTYGSNTDVNFCLQLLRPENKKHLGDIDEDESKLVVCLNEMKMGALAKACLFPGVNTLIFNLLSSFAEDEDPLAEQVGVHKFDPDETEEDEIGTWLEEYEKGCGWEIYITELADAFEGQKFVDLAYTLYDKIGIVLFALRVKELKGRQHVRVLLNPAEFIIPNKDDYRIDGFVIAENKKQSDLKFTPMPADQNPFHRLQTLVSMGGGGEPRIPGGRRDSVSSSGTAPESRRGSAAAKPATFRWQDVKSDYDAEREIKVGNAQEILSKQESEYVFNNFFQRKSPITLEEATIETAVLDEIPNVNQHIIIIGKGLNSLYDFVRPWRAKYLGRLKHIVILNPGGVSEATWRRVSMFEGIVYVKGSSLEENDLRRAGIFKAAQVVILADGVRKHKTGSTSNSSDALEDADAIFTYQLVKRLNEKAHVVVEIVHSSNVGYLDAGDSDALVRAEDYKFTPQFASGTLYTSSLLDTVLCQTFYNPQIIKVVDKLISGTDHTPEEPLLDEADMTSDEKMKKNKKSKKSKTKVNTKLFDGMGSSLHQILVPDDLKKQNYGELFKYLSERGMIPLGLLRGTFPAMNIGPKGNKLPYVYTNPSKDTEVFSCDKVFVLSQKSLNNTKYTAEEIHENFLKQTETAILTRRAEKDSEGDMIRPKTGMQKELDKFFNAMSGQVNGLSSAVGEMHSKTMGAAVSAFGAGANGRLSVRRPTTGIGARISIKGPSLGSATPRVSSRSLKVPALAPVKPVSSAPVAPIATPPARKVFVPTRASTVRRTDISSGQRNRARTMTDDTNGSISSNETC
jgi:hypothetical protein